MEPSAAPLIESPVVPSDKEKNAAMLVHLMMLLGVTLLPVVGFIVAVVIWRTNAGKSEFVNRHGASAANLIISLCVYGIVLGAFGIAGSAIGTAMVDNEERGGLTLIFGLLAVTWILMTVVWIINIVTTCVGIARATSGCSHRYFHAFPFIVSRT